MKDARSAGRARAAARLLAGAGTLLVAAALLSACSSADRSSAPTPSPAAPKEGTVVFALSSPAFEDGGLIPGRYANTGVAGGENVSIPYEWRGAPEGTRSFAFVLVDRHPIARSWVHWMVAEIPLSTTALSAGASGRSMPGGAVELRNTFGGVGYGGPQPPAGSGRHEYEAIIYALDVDALWLDELSSLDEFNAALDGLVLAKASCSGFFGR